MFKKIGNYLYIPSGFVAGYGLGSNEILMVIFGLVGMAISFYHIGTQNDVDSRYP